MKEINEEELKYYLYKTYLSLDDIGKLYNTTRYFINKYMKEHNIKPRSKEYVNQITGKNSQITKKKTWTPEKVKQINLKRQQTNIKRYNNPFYNNMQKNKETKLKNYGDENYNNIEKHKQTCLERYGFTNYTTKRVHDGTYRSPFLNRRVVEKGFKTKIERYNDIGYNNFEKALKTSWHRKTGGMESKTELKLYEELKNNFTDVVHQYNIPCIRSWFDFRIDNLLIELNGSFWHNYRPFKNTEENIKEYNTLIDKGGLYKTIANTWRYKDVQKLNYCKENNIKLLVIYFGNYNFKVEDNILYTNSLDGIISYLKSIL